MMLEADTIDRCLDAAVEQFDDQNDENGADQQCPLDPVLPKPQTEREQHDTERELLPECRLPANRADKTLPGVAERVEEPDESGRFVSIGFHQAAESTGFQVSSSCLAARTSSRRRTGMV